MTPSSSAHATAPLAATVDIETPELVVLSYTLAGIGSRAAAAIIDFLVAFVLFIGLVYAIIHLAPSDTASAPEASDAWALTVVVLVQFAIVWGYYVLFEALADGQTPGKRVLHLRVVRDGGYSITFGASAIRNLVRIVDMQPIVFYGVGIVSLLFSRSGKRLGDYAAGTIVVREQLASALTRETHRGSDAGRAEPAALHTRLTEAEYAVLEGFVDRFSQLTRERQAALAAQLAERLAPALAGYEGSDAARLRRLLTDERSARHAGVAARDDRGAARERHAIVAAGSARWAAFATRLAEARRRGLRGLSEKSVREFVAEYRDLSADLARLATAERGRETPELFYLNRLVASAHNLLYRRRALTPRQTVRFLFGDVPREIRRSWRPVLLAAGLLFVPAFIAGEAVYRTPGVAAMLLPPAMLDRAQEGVNRARSGEGYIADPQVFRPVMASTIITNNVQVTFGAFAAGMTAGVGTVWLLIANGISIGAVVGLYASKGIAALLLAFIAPHGVLELSAICIAGGAGFLLAAALLLPGPRTRRRALAENGQRAIRMIAGSAMLLVVAGTLEGFVSPIEWWPLTVKLCLSAATAVALVEFLRLGRTARGAAPTPSERAAPLDLEIPVDHAGGHHAR